MSLASMNVDGTRAKQKHVRLEKRICLRKKNLTSYHAVSNLWRLGDYESRELASPEFQSQKKTEISLVVAHKDNDGLLHKAIFARDFEFLRNSIRKSS